RSPDSIASPSVSKLRSSGILILAPFASRNLPVLIKTFGDGRFEIKNRKPSTFEVTVNRVGSQTLAENPPAHQKHALSARWVALTDTLPLYRQIELAPLAYCQELP